MVEQVHHFHALTCKSLRVTLESIASNLRAALTITATPAGATRSQIFPLLLLLMFLLIICEKIVLVLLGCFTSVRVVDAAAHGVSIGGHLNTFGSFSSAFVHDGESRGLFAIWRCSAVVKLDDSVHRVLLNRCQWLAHLLLEFQDWSCLLLATGMVRIWTDCRIFGIWDVQCATLLLLLMNLIYLKLLQRGRVPFAHFLTKLLETCAAKDLKARHNPKEVTRNFAIIGYQVGHHLIACQFDPLNWNID